LEADGMDPVITEQLGPRRPTPAAANRFRQR
jgi:hypothetical protein